MKRRAFLTALATLVSWFTIKPKVHADAINGSFKTPIGLFWGEYSINLWPRRGLAVSIPDANSHPWPHDDRRFAAVTRVDARTFRFRTLDGWLSLDDIQAMADHVDLQVGAPVATLRMCHGVRRSVLVLLDEAKADLVAGELAGVPVYVNADEVPGTITMTVAGLLDNIDNGGGTALWDEARW